MEKSAVILLFFAIFLSGTAFSQEAERPVSSERPDGPVPWTNMEFNNAPENFQFVIVTDRTGGHRPGVFLDGVHKVNLLQPEFVMSVGDLIEGYTEDTVELRRQWEEFDGFVQQLEMPFFYVPGNHDITNAVMDSVWQARYGASYYYFMYKDVLFLCLNSEDQFRGSGRGSISDEQYEWIRGVLNENDDLRWTFVFMHQPLWIQETDPVRWGEVEALLRDRPHTVFVGHRHRYAKFDRNNGKYIMLATTGGGSRLRGPELGEFDHFVWVTMTDDGPVLANLNLSGVHNENIATDQTLAFMEKMQQRSPLRIEPLYINPNAGFSSGTARIRLTNDEDVPMTVRLRDKFSWDLKSDLSQDMITVDPNSVAFIDMELAPRKQKPLETHEPVVLEAGITYDAPDLAHITYPLSLKISPEVEYQLTRAEHPVKIDGALDEWSGFSYTAEAPDPANCSARFQAAYDDDYLYVAARVTDDHVRVDERKVVFNQDFVGLVLNGDPLAQSVMDTGESNYENSMAFLASPATSTIEAASYGAEKLPEGARWSCKLIAGGYALEFALPLSYLQERQGDNWGTARINFVVQDKDEGETESRIYSWQPEWRSAENRIGSGMFFRVEESR